MKGVSIMKYIIKHKYFIFIFLIIISVLFYLSKSINLEEGFEGSSNVIVIKNYVDEAANKKSESIYLKEEDIERLSNLLEDKSLYYLYETTEGYFFPYYPITFYDFYISNDNNVIQRLEVVENGRIFCNDSDYYSFDRAEIFKVIDDFYNSLNYK